MKFIYWLFKKQIHRVAEELLKELALDKYVEENFFLEGRSDGSIELQFRGKKFIQYMAAGVYELVKNADNYITMDLISTELEPITIVIQKRWKLSPHEKAEKLERENELLKNQLEELMSIINH
jgi:hypothetical protein